MSKYSSQVLGGSFLILLNLVSKIFRKETIKFHLPETKCKSKQAHHALKQTNERTSRQKQKNKKQKTKTNLSVR